jgi:hypothetical protein
MTERRTIARRTAEMLAQAATGWLEPTRRGAWARAMRAELDHIESDYEAVRWALGCALAAVTLRRTDMDMGTLRVSRFVVALEMALCFVPLTFVWVDVVVGNSGVAWLDPESVRRYYLGNTEGVAALAKMFAGALIGVLGPLGVIVALRYIVLGRGLTRGMISFAMIAGPLLLGVVYVIGNMATDTRFTPSWFGFYVLFVGLPVAGAMHLLYLGRPQVDRPVAVV